MIVYSEVILETIRMIWFQCLVVHGQKDLRFDTRYILSYSKDKIHLKHILKVQKFYFVCQVVIESHRLAANVFEVKEGVVYLVTEGTDSIATLETPDESNIIVSNLQIQNDQNQIASRRASAIELPSNLT